MLKNILKWLGLVVGLAALAIGLFLFSMRYTDGPIAILTGGPFASGDPATSPVDWNFLQGRDTIEFQTLEPARSRTVWLAVHQGRLFIVSGYMNTGYGRIWKQWPHYLEDDDRIIVRIDGQLYEQRLHRITSGPDIIPVLQILVDKYGGGAVVDSDASVTNGDTWMFEVVSR